MPQIVNSNNNFLARIVQQGEFTGVVHDETLSGLGTNDSPLGCIKNDFTGVITDSTISGNGYDSNLGVVDPWTGVNHDNNLTGNGKDEDLGLNSALDMGEGSIKFTDSLGDVYVDAMNIRNWNAGGGPGMNHVRHDDNLTGDGNTEVLGLSSNVRFDSQYSWSQVNGDTISVHSKQNTSAANVQIGTTNYGATPYFKITDSDNQQEYIYCGDITKWNNKVDIVVSMAGPVTIGSPTNGSGYAINTGLSTGFIFNNGAGLLAGKDLRHTPYSAETSGVDFYGSYAYDEGCVKLMSNENPGQPFVFQVPAKSTIDIDYDAIIGASRVADGKYFPIGITLDGESAFVDMQKIVFPGAILDDHDYGSTSTNLHAKLRYKNTQNSAVNLNIGFNTQYNGALPDIASWWVGDDRIIARIYNN